MLKPSAARFRLTLLLAALVSGCTYVNTQLNDPQVALEQRVGNHTRAGTGAEVAPAMTKGDEQLRAGAGARPGAAPTAQDRPGDHDGYFVGLALSGGGSRSANFSAACMFQLERLGLLDRVDYISSVSGGSLTAAYYCLSGPEWNPGNVQEKLTHSFATDLFIQTILPWNYAGLAFTDLDRSDLLAGIFNNVLFSRDGRPLTFADLRTDRPRLLLNCTDLQNGRRFIFCDETFDEINSDLSKYPMANAVAASAAVPVLLHHVTLRDFSTTFKQYRHLLDGGITDNLGVLSLVETYAVQQRAAQQAGLPDPYPNGAILVVVDAHTQFDAKLSNKGDIGLITALTTGAGLTSTALLNRVSSATLAEIIVKYSPDDTTAKVLREQIRALSKQGYLELNDQGGHRVRVLVLALSQLNELSNLPFQSFHESVNSIATYFNIDPTEAYNLYEAAELLVKEKFEPKIAQLVSELDVATTRPATAPQDGAPPAGP